MNSEKLRSSEIGTRAWQPIHTTEPSHLQMPVEFKDYYATLGITPAASDDEVKAAFRKLARLYHPDVAADKLGTAGKFAEINEANEVLHDPEKRKAYDTMRANRDNESSQGPPRHRHGSYNADRGDGAYHFTGTGFSDFFEQYFGGHENFGYNFDPNASGNNRRDAPRAGSDIEGEILVTLEEVVRGTTRPISLRTENQQTGQSESSSFQARVPAGAMEGRRIRIPGKGQLGQNGAPAGDLYLRVRYAAHPDFTAQGADLYHEVELAPHDAVLGTTVRVPSFEGTIKTRIPPLSNSGTRLRVKGHGLPKGKSGERGDLIVVIKVQLPESISETQKSLWEQLRQASQPEPVNSSNTK